MTSVDWPFLIDHFWLTPLDWPLLIDLYWLTSLDSDFLNDPSWLTSIGWSFLIELYWLNYLDWPLFIDLSWFPTLNWHLLIYLSWLTSFLLFQINSNFFIMIFVWPFLAYSTECNELFSLIVIVWFSLNEFPCFNPVHWVYRIICLFNWPLMIIPISFSLLIHPLKSILVFEEPQFHCQF